MPEARPLTGAILAGGASSRMGRDKSRLELGGETLVARLARQLGELCDELLVVGNAVPDVPEVAGCRGVPDAHRERCSLTGLYSALAAASFPRVLVVACDLPFVERELLELLLRLWRPELLSLVPLGPDGAQPLLALYGSGLAPRLRTRLDEGRFRIRAALDPRRHAYLPWSSLRRLGVTPQTFWNLNTPEELERARRLLET